MKQWRAGRKQHLSLRRARATPTALPSLPRGAAALPAAQPHHWVCGGLRQQRIGIIVDGRAAGGRPAVHKTFAKQGIHRAKAQGHLDGGGGRAGRMSRCAVLPRLLLRAAQRTAHKGVPHAPPLRAEWGGAAAALQLRSQRG